MAKVVLALGGNALGNTPSEQKDAVKTTAEAVVKLVSDGHKVMIVHGNGPQVGMINNAFASALEANTTKEEMPFPECGALSQGYIGYHLQNAIANELAKQNMDKTVATIVSQTIVDKSDSAFQNPTKPIGGFMDEATAKSLAEQNGWTVKEDSGRGWRRVVASPKPTSVKEVAAIKTLVDNDYIVIAGGGGGVPVIVDNGTLEGVAAVIDKDSTAAILAEATGADAFIVLTAVERVMVNFGKENQEAIEEMNIEEAKKHIEDGQFAPGSMLPKVEATIDFAKKTGKPAYIGDLKDALDIIAGTKGTKIVA